MNEDESYPPAISPFSTAESVENSSIRSPYFRSGVMNRSNSLIALLQASLLDLLSSYIDPLIKQWIKNIHLTGLIILHLIQKCLPASPISIPKEVNGKALDPSVRTVLSTGMETGLIHGLVSRLGKPFSAYLKMNPSGKLEYRFPDPSKGLGKIPITGPHEAYIPSNVLGVQLEPKVREALHKGEESPLVEGLVSKKGNKFNAYLSMDLSGKLHFRFPERGASLEKFPQPNLSPAAANADQPQLKASQERGGLTAGINLKPPSEEAKTSADPDLSQMGLVPFQEPPPGGAQNSPGPVQEPPLRETQTSAGRPVQEPPLRETQTSAGPVQEPPLRETQTSAGPVHELPSEGASVDWPAPTQASKSGRSNHQPILFLGQELDGQTLKTLERGEETGLLEGLVTPSGKIFDAYLRSPAPGKIQLRIPSREKDLKIFAIPKIILGVSLSEQHKQALRMGQETPLIPNLRFKHEPPFTGCLKVGENGNIFVKTPELNRVVSGFVI